jgi:hypothetical protein
MRVFAKGKRCYRSLEAINARWGWRGLDCFSFSKEFWGNWQLIFFFIKKKINLDVTPL